MHAFGLPGLGGVEAARGPLRVASHTARGLFGIGVRAIPIRAPFPDVAGHVVQAVAVGRELADGRDAGEAVLGGIAARGTAPARCWPSTCRPGETHRPRSKAGRPCRRGPRIPTRPRSAAACRPSGRKPRHLHRRHARRDIRRGRRCCWRALGMPPVGPLHVAPPPVMIVERNRLGGGVNTTEPATRFSAGAPGNSAAVGVRSATVT